MQMNFTNTKKSPVHIVKEAAKGSIAEEMEIEPGDVLLSINGKEVRDIFDYRFLQAESKLLVLIQKPSGEQWELDIEKDENEDLGIVFENDLMDDYRSCRNHCIFCFIDQMPPGMRETLYFKDDDSRLSFLQGNYVTLTNMADEDIDRLISYHLEPINISIHTTNPELRKRMLNNRFAGEVFSKIRKLADAGIHMNAQIVLCRNVNDGKELDRTLHDLEEYLPSMQSVAIVPVGLTKFRKGLEPLIPYDRESARGVLDDIHAWQTYYRGKYGFRFVHASDEWYLLAGEELPSEEQYEGFEQLENGVGMLRLLEKEIGDELDRRLPFPEDSEKRNRRVSVVTGLLPAPFLDKQLQRIRKAGPIDQVLLYPLENKFFGEMITVSGLLTGQDILSGLRGKDLGDELLIPNSMLRYGTETFLDDRTVQDLERELQTPIRITGQEGASLVHAVLGEAEDKLPGRRQKYE